MECRRCEACGQMFRLRYAGQKQSFCGSADCQRERRRRWQQQKRQGDPDYRANQQQAQRCWSKRHPDYWRHYRETHPSYKDRNRAACRERRRARRRRDDTFAKMDASPPIAAVPSGTYKLVSAASSMFAKMDALTVEITVIPGPSPASGVVGGCLQREDPMAGTGPRCQPSGYEHRRPDSRPAPP